MDGAGGVVPSDGLYSMQVKDGEDWASRAPKTGAFARTYDADLVSDERPIR